MCAMICAYTYTKRQCSDQNTVHVFCTSFSSNSVDTHEIMHPPIIIAAEQVGYKTPAEPASGPKFRPGNIFLCICMGWLCTYVFVAGCLFSDMLMRWLDVEWQTVL